jgi:hypothetical protein
MVLSIMRSLRSIREPSRTMLNDQGTYFCEAGFALA